MRVAKHHQPGRTTVVDMVVARAKLGAGTERDATGIILADASQ